MRVFLIGESMIRGFVIGLYASTLILWHNELLTVEEVRLWSGFVLGIGIFMIGAIIAVSAEVDSREGA